MKTMAQMENQMKEVVRAIEALTEQVEQLNTEISYLNQGQIWSGTLVDALNEIAKSLQEKK
jgi:cell division protein FtsB